MASRVEFEPAPAITGTRPSAPSMHHSTTRLCSSWLTVGLSPVVPTGTRPLVPSAICQFTSPRKAASSSEPFLKGVTRAVKDPRNFVFAAMDFSLRARSSRPLKLPIRPFIPGMTVWRKSGKPRVNEPLLVRHGPREALVKRTGWPRFCRGDDANTSCCPRIGYFPLNLRTLVFLDSPKEECRDLFRSHQSFAFDSASEHAGADSRIGDLPERNRRQTEGSLPEASSDRPERRAQDSGEDKREEGGQDR